MAEMMQAYGKAAEFFEAERIACLSWLGPQEARVLFERLYAVWERGGAKPVAIGMRLSACGLKNSLPCAGLLNDGGALTVS